jgi:hypothetical protein
METGACLRGKVVFGGLPRWFFQWHLAKAGSLGTNDEASACERGGLFVDSFCLFSDEWPRHFLLEK